MNRLKEKFNMWVAWHLPKSIVMWCFIQVIGLSGNGPGQEYRDAYKLAKERWHLKDF